MAGGLSLFAFEAPNKSKIIIAVNNSKAKRVLEPDISFNAVQVITTDQNEQLAFKSPADKKIDVAPMSIATIIMR